MKYRKWDPKTKAKIVLEGLQNNQPLSELCNNYQISQNQYYNWLNEFQAKSLGFYLTKTLFIYNLELFYCVQY